MNSIESINDTLAWATGCTPVVSNADLCRRAWSRSWASHLDLSCVPVLTHPPCVAIHPSWVMGAAHHGLPAQVVFRPRGAPTDIDGDGDTDFADLTAIARWFNKPPIKLSETAAADINRDGIVDFADLVQVARNFDARNAITRTVTRTIQCGNDIIIGQLNEPLPSTITITPFVRRTDLSRMRLDVEGLLTMGVQQGLSRVHLWGAASSMLVSPVTQRIECRMSDPMSQRATMVKRLQGRVRGLVPGVGTPSGEPGDSGSPFFALTLDGLLLLGPVQRVGEKTNPVGDQSACVGAAWQMRDVIEAFTGPLA